MLKAVFDTGRRTATGEYVYQYDRGQVMEVYGLPTHNQKSDIVTVQFAFATDKQTIGTESIWDKGVLRAKIPDEILLESQEARAYIYFTQGKEEASTRYEVIFTPISRPAPSDRVPIEVSNEWDGLKAEIATHIDEVDAAANRANAAAAGVTQEIAALNKDKAEWEARVSEVERRTPGRMITEVSRRAVSVPTSGWTKNAQGMQELQVSVPGTKKDSGTQRVHYAVRGEQIGRVLLAGARVDGDDTLTLVCLAAPPAAFELMVTVEEVIV